MSIDIMSWVWKHSPTKGSARLVLLALADNANDTGYCWPSQATIARKANLGKRHTIRVLEELEDQGCIKRIQRAENGKNLTTMYQVIVTPETLSLVTPESPGSVPQDTRVVTPESLKPPINPHLTPGEGEALPTSNLFAVYEQEIGPLTALVRDRLIDAEEIDTAAWVAKAIQIAAENNKRSWSYIEAILRRWRVDGYGSEYPRKNGNGKKPAPITEPAGFAGLREFLRKEGLDVNQVGDLGNFSDVGLGVPPVQSDG